VGLQNTLGAPQTSRRVGEENPLTRLILIGSEAFFSFFEKTRSNRRLPPNQHSPRAFIDTMQAAETPGAASKASPGGARGSSPTALLLAGGGSVHWF
jgi:hypothetical protein